MFYIIINQFWKSHVNLLFFITVVVFTVTIINSFCHAIWYLMNNMLFVWNNSCTTLAYFDKSTIYYSINHWYFDSTMLYTRTIVYVMILSLTFIFCYTTIFSLVNHLIMLNGISTRTKLIRIFIIFSRARSKMIIFRIKSRSLNIDNLLHSKISFRFLREVFFYFNK